MIDTIRQNVICPQFNAGCIAIDDNCALAGPVHSCIKGDFPLIVGIAGTGDPNAIHITESKSSGGRRKCHRRIPRRQPKCFAGIRLDKFNLAREECSVPILDPANAAVAGHSDTRNACRMFIIDTTSRSRRFFEVDNVNISVFADSSICADR